MKDGTKILIVDDDRDIVEGMRVVLESKGCRVFAGFDYDEGLAKVREVKPDLLILDAMLLLHQKTGFELSQEIRKDPATKDIPILMVSAVNETPAGFEFSPIPGGEHMSVDDFIDKPVRPDVLFSKIEKLLASGAGR